jgi:hypothetical protein
VLFGTLRYHCVVSIAIPLPRAARVLLPIPISYRRAGEDDWLPSRVQNISESGVLFGPTGLEPGTPVEVMFSPPVSVGSLAPGKQVCVGEVVRAAGVSVVAARFEECRYVLEA